MNLSSGTYEDISFDEAKKLCKITFSRIIKFTRAADQLLGNSFFLDATNRIECLMEKIGSSSKPSFVNFEIDGMMKPMLDKLVSWRPHLIPKLEPFWKALVELVEQADKQSTETNQITFDLLRELNKQSNRIDSAAGIYLFAEKEFLGNSDNNANLYCLFYAHILRTETAEYAYRKQFYKNLKKVNLDKKYDANEIFSASNKVSKAEKKNKQWVPGWTTDGRAIRDALTHYRYTITRNGSSLKIKFDNQEYGYDFHQSYTKEEFIKLMNDIDALYKTQLQLINLFYGVAIAKGHFQI